MDEKAVQSMTDAEFDALLQSSLPPEPPEEIAADVTPWRKAMWRVLVGMALTTVTLQLFGLQYILPFIGALLMLLGFRALRRENPWFRACYALSGLRLGLIAAADIANASILLQRLLSPLLDSLLWLLLTLSILFSLLFCFRKGLLAVQEKCGLPPHAASATWLLVFYGVLCIFAILEYNGLFLGWILLLVYGILLFHLVRISKEAADAGYAIRPVPARISDRALTVSVTALTLGGIFCGLFFGCSYPMAWTERSSDEQAGVAAIREELLEKGFPASVLDDMAPADIAACEGAVRVLAQYRDFPINPGHEESELEGTVTHIYTAYDAEELRLTQVAVLLPGENPHFQIIQHFSFTEDPGFWGTECVQLYPVYNNLPEGWRGRDEALTGRVLYTDSDGTEFISPYEYLGPQSYTKSNILWGPQESHDLFGTFSFPRGDRRQRGYVQYPIEALNDQFIVDGWIFYCHQFTPLQYPAKTAMEHRMAGFAFKDRPFMVQQDALQFFPFEPGYHLRSGNGVQILS